MRVDGFENRPPWPAMQWCQGACGDVKLELPWQLKPLHSVGSKVFESKFGGGVNNLSQSRQIGYAKVAPGGFRVSNLTLNHLQAQIQSLTTKFGQWGKNDVKEMPSPPLSPEEHEMLCEDFERWRIQSRGASELLLNHFQCLFATHGNG